MGRFLGGPADPQAGTYAVELAGARGIELRGCTFITDTGIVSLGWLPRLASLDVRGCPQASADDRTPSRLQCKHCGVSSLPRAARVRLRALQARENDLTAAKKKLSRPPFLSFPLLCASRSRWRAWTT